VSRVSGVSFAEFTRREFFAPLGMTSTSWRADPTRLVRGRAQAYSPDGTGGWRLDMPFEHVHGNGGLLTTVSDLQLWTQAIATGSVGSPNVSARMLQEGQLRDGKGAGYGGGLFLGDVNGVRAVYHGGATAGYRAFLARFAESDVRVAVLCNRGDANPQALATQLLQSTVPFVRATATASASAPVTPVRVVYDSTAFAEYGGAFTSEEAAAQWTVSARRTGLVFSRWNGDVAPLRPTDKDQFAGPSGLQLRYTRDAGGRITGFTVDISRALGVEFTRR
jgi:CubicO group peptidase (beta-lactamase class C family)